MSEQRLFDKLPRDIQDRVQAGLDEIRQAAAPKHRATPDLEKLASEIFGRLATAGHEFNDSLSRWELCKKQDLAMVLKALQSVRDEMLLAQLPSEEIQTWLNEMDAVVTRHDTEHGLQHSEVYHVVTERCTYIRLALRAFVEGSK